MHHPPCVVFTFYCGSENGAAVSVCSRGRELARLGGVLVVIVIVYPEAAPYHRGTFFDFGFCLAGPPLPPVPTRAPVVSLFKARRSRGGFK